MRPWLPLLFVACGPSLSSIRDYETNVFWRSTPSRLSCARATTTSASSFELGEPCVITGVPLPAGTGVTRLPAPGEINVYPREPLKTPEPVICRREREATFVAGHLTRCWLMRSAVIEGVPIMASLVEVNHAERRVVGLLDGDQDIGGMPLANESLIIVRHGHLERGTLRVPRVIGGWRVPARASIGFHDNGNLAMIDYADDVFAIRVGSWSGTAYYVGFFESGPVQMVTTDRPDGRLVDISFDLEGHVTTEVEHPPEVI